MSMANTRFRRCALFVEVIGTVRAQNAAPVGLENLCWLPAFAIQQDAETAIPAGGVDPGIAPPGSRWQKPRGGVCGSEGLLIRFKAGNEDLLEASGTTFCKSIEFNDAWTSMEPFPEPDELGPKFLGGYGLEFDA